MSASLVHKPSKRGGRLYYIVESSYKYGSDGKRQRVQKWTSLGNIPARKAHKSLSDRQAGIAPAPQRITVSELLDDWQANRAEVSPGTARDHKRLIDSHILPALGALRLSECSPLVLSRFVTSLNKEGSRLNGKSEPLGFSARRQIFQILRQAFRWASDTGQTLDYMAKLKPPRRAKDDLPNRPLMTAEQAQTLLDRNQDEPLLPLATLLLLSGLRISESLALRWEDLDGTTLHVRRQIIDGKETTPKTRSSLRQIPLSAMALSLLAEVRAEQDSGRERLGNGYQNSGYIFTNAYGARLDDANVRRAFRRMGSRAELPFTLSPHAFRRTFTTLAIEAGADLLGVSQILGHTSTVMTAQYAGKLHTRQEQAVQMVADALTII